MRHTNRVDVNGFETQMVGIVKSSAITNVMTSIKLQTIDGGI